MPSPQAHERPIDAIVVGGGIAGLYMLHRLRETGFCAQVLEAGGGVGGTWFWNRYPGARCDIESLEYSFHFSAELEQEWEWTERYASQPEILRYLNHVADRFDLRRDINLNTRVVSARFIEQDGCWSVRTAAGDTFAARFLIMATGCLSKPNIPDLPGLAEFGGPAHHTGAWPHEPINLRGERVAIIGTGSSAVQAIPVVAQQAREVYVFQRTAAYVVPARNEPMDPGRQRQVKQNYAEFRRRALAQSAAAHFDISDMRAVDLETPSRTEVLEARWRRGGLPFIGAFADVMTDRGANEIVAQFVRDKVREAVADPAVAARLSPTHVFGCKRLCVGTDYFETFNRENVALVDTKVDPIVAIEPWGIRTSSHSYDVDRIILATGFDAMTGALLSIDIRGPDGRSLQQAWEAGAEAYLGLCVAGFPNMFTVTGPGSPAVLANMVPAIEQHVDWIAACMDGMRRDGMHIIEAKQEAQSAWASHVSRLAAGTLYSACRSWYIGANIPGKPRRFMAYLGFPDYVAHCEGIVRTGYRGFERRTAAARLEDLGIPYG
jgi:cyclohexanone monooxygenase